MKTILAAIDSSSMADLVAAEAATLARAAQGRVVLVSVVQPPVISSEFVPMVENLEEITAAGEKAAADRLGRLQQRLAAEGIQAKSVRMTGGPISHILGVARAEAADYIVMGSHGHTALYDLLVGSTTHGVLLRAPCPVVIVPAKDKTAKQDR